MKKFGQKIRDFLDHAVTSKDCQHIQSIDCLENANFKKAFDVGENRVHDNKLWPQIFILFYIN